jgi:inhibitor of cysteine peptidase
MFRKTLFLSSLILVLVLTACGPATAKLTAEENGGQIEVKAGDLIGISLAGNPSTGYTWESKDLDATMFEQVGEAEFKSDNPSLVGAGGTLTLTFKALKAGTATLNLVYHRPWETDVEPLDTFSVTVTVK